MSLQIGTITLTAIEGLDIEQSYEPIGGESLFRTVNGTGTPVSSPVVGLLRPGFSLPAG